MRRAGLPASVVGVWFALILCLPAIAQDSPELAPTEPRRIPVFGNADEFAVLSDFEYYDPQPGFDRQNRDMDLQVSTISLARTCATDGNSNSTDSPFARTVTAHHRAVIHIPKLRAMRRAWASAH
jgi:hypothetical protein